MKAGLLFPRRVREESSDFHGGSLLLVVGNAFVSPASRSNTLPKLGHRKRRELVKKKAYGSRERWREGDKPASQQTIKRGRVVVAVNLLQLRGRLYGAYTGEKFKVAQVVLFIA